MIKSNTAFTWFLQLWRINETTFNLRVFGNQFVGVNSSGGVVATATTPGPSETFQLVRWDSDKSRVRIRAPNGLFLQVIKTASACLPLGFGNAMCKASNNASGAHGLLASAKSHMCCIHLIWICVLMAICAGPWRSELESNMHSATCQWCENVRLVYCTNYILINMTST